MQVQVKNDNQEYIVSIFGGYPKETRDEKTGNLIKVDIEDILILDKNIGSETGNVFAEEDAVVKGDVGHDYTQKGKNVEITECEKQGKRVATGDVNGTVHAKENVTVSGNVSGSTRGNLMSEKHRKMNMIKNGNIVSDYGNITIK